jgi:membrane dipeptidase
MIRPSSWTRGHAFTGVLLLCALFLASCASVERSAVDIRMDRARVLAESLLVLDSHLDIPYRLSARMADISGRTRTTDFDYVKAMEGGMDVAVCAVYTPQRIEGNGSPKEFALQQIAFTEGLAKLWPGKFRMVSSTVQIRAGAGTGQVMFALGMENGIPLEGDTANVRLFFDRGIRYITLVHTRANSLADASFDTTRRWNGLSPFGTDVIDAMNRVGMMVDVSHMSDSAFYQAVRRSRAPVIASHSSCRAFTPGFERNMSDDMIRALAARGGVMQINFGSMFLVDSLRGLMARAGEEIGAYLREHNLRSHDEEATAYARRYRKEHGIPYASAADIARHIDHVVKLVGIDHVGLGSDFEGLGDDLPDGVKDVSGYPAVICALLTLGYDERAIAKVCGENFLRVWDNVTAVAAQPSH